MTLLTLFDFDFSGVRSLRQKYWAWLAPIAKRPLAVPLMRHIDVAVVLGNHAEVFLADFHKFLRRFNHRRRERVLRKTTDTVIKILNDFNPIPVIKGGSRHVMETLKQSLNALIDGSNLLIFPEHPRTAFDGNFVREHDEAGTLRSFYSGFAHIGQMYFEHTKQNLLFVPIYINRKRHTMCINPPVAYEASGDTRRDRQRLSDRLYAAISTMKND